MPSPLVSICIATYDKPLYLERVLRSIYRQTPPFDYEVIVVDDGSPSDETARLLQRFSSIQRVRSYRIARDPHYRNPSVARNVAYRAARGEIIIAQSDDVEHEGEATSELVEWLEEGTFTLANVFNTDFDGNPVPCHGNWVELIGPEGRARRPIFFLGALFRRDMYAIGGNEERFTAPGREDMYFGQCLVNGLGLTPRWLRSARGRHLHHDRPADLGRLSEPSRALYRDLAREGRWIASGGPWEVAGASP